MERAAGFEPATPNLASSCATNCAMHAPQTFDWRVCSDLNGDHRFWRPASCQLNDRPEDGGLAGNRTPNLGVKSALLCQLSYKPFFL